MLRMSALDEHGIALFITARFAPKKFERARVADAGPAASARCANALGKNSGSKSAPGTPPERNRRLTVSVFVKRTGSPTGELGLSVSHGSGGGGRIIRKNLVSASGAIKPVADMPPRLSAWTLIRSMNAIAASAKFAGSPLVKNTSPSTTSFRSREAALTYLRTFRRHICVATYGGTFISLHRLASPSRNSACSAAVVVPAPSSTSERPA